MRFLVTGGEGFIGRHLRARIASEGHQAISMDDYRANPLSPTSNQNIDRAIESIEPSDLEGVDTVVHLASYKNVPESFGKTRECLDNVRATQALLEACSKTNVRRVLIGSTCEVFGRAHAPIQYAHTPLAPRSPYALSKAASECVAEIYRYAGQFEVSRVRIFNTYGPFERPDAVVPAMCKLAIETGTITIEGDGSQSRDFTYVTDMADRLYALAMVERLPVTANLGSGHTTTVEEIAAVVSSHAKQSRGIDVQLAFTGARQEEINSFCSSTEDWDHALGANDAPHVDIREGIARTFEWWSARLGSADNELAVLS